VVDLALDTGFGDVSNFNRAFRAEFGVNPLAYRAAARKAGPQELRNVLGEKALQCAWRENHSECWA
jgi:AraC-like DNA-binding protein